MCIFKISYTFLSYTATQSNIETSTSTRKLTNRRPTIDTINTNKKRQTDDLLDDQELFKDNLVKQQENHKIHNELLEMQKKKIKIGIEKSEIELQQAKLELEKTKLALETARELSKIEIEKQKRLAEMEIETKEIELRKNKNS